MPVDPEACIAGLTMYLGGGDEPSEATTAAFGERDPFANCPDGLDGIIREMLKVSNNTAEFPGEDDADLPVSAALMGSMVARAELAMPARNAIKAFIRLVRGDHLAHYEDALKMGAAEAADTAATPADEARVKSLTGMPLCESLALYFSMATFTVLSVATLKTIPHGTDPLQWSGFKQQAKFGQRTFLDYLKPKADPADLRRQLKKLVQTLREKGWTTASATLATWLDELSELTFEQGVPQYFLDYYNEYMEVNRCRGLIVSRPLDDDILRRKVLGQRGATAGGTNFGEQVTELQSSNETLTKQVEELLREVRKGQSQNASLKDQVARLREAGGGKPGGASTSATPTTKPGPSAEHTCYECGSPDHFGYNCPVRAAKLKEAEEAKKKAAKESEPKSE